MKYTLHKDIVCNIPKNDNSSDESSKSIIHITDSSKAIADEKEKDFNLKECVVSFSGKTNGSPWKVELNAIEDYGRDQKDRVYSNVEEYIKDKYPDNAKNWQLYRKPFTCTLDDLKSPDFFKDTTKKENEWSNWSEYFRTEHNYDNYDYIMETISDTKEVYMDDIIGDINNICVYIDDKQNIHIITAKDNESLDEKKRDPNILKNSISFSKKDFTNKSKFQTTISDKYSECYDFFFTLKNMTVQEYICKKYDKLFEQKAHEPFVTSPLVGKKKSVRIDNGIVYAAPVKKYAHLWLKSNDGKDMLFFDHDQKQDAFIQSVINLYKDLYEEKTEETVQMEITKSDSDKSKQDQNADGTNGYKWENDYKKELDNYKQIIFTGAPGTGKTYSIKKYVESKCENADGKLKFHDRQICQRKLVQFHSSYDYTDFVEGIRPVDVENESKFLRIDGVFKAFCRDIVEYNNENSNNDTQFYFIIDEINRADLGKVFGELMYCLDESYRGADNAVPTQYQNLRTYYIGKNDSEKSGFLGDPDVNKKVHTDVFKDGFYIPENLHIIGTMNDIDRSVESFDFALRRRFRWVEVNAMDIMEGTLVSMIENRDDNKDKKVDKDKIHNFVESGIKALNNQIIAKGDDGGAQFGLNAAYQIGPAYFKEYDYTNDKDSREDIWARRIEPILREYVRGRASEKINKFIDKCNKAFMIQTPVTDNDVNDKHEEE